ncbi:SigE family RNA polymerase sigma factor [Actinoplanes sp. NPDC020271]|uniref:SigE family RNA polymerase sigma factor n=1 Tax=Actinoplanes sp. NPDC020271 TaxID=3363896 RepID=UPI0037B60C04
MSDRESEFRTFAAARMESLRGLAYLTCGDWQTAEDAVMSALSKLYVRWSRVENPEAYARTAVVRAAIDETRRPWWRRERAHGHALPDRVVPDGAPVVDERLRMRAALGRLPAKQRAVIVLRFLEGLSVQQTASTLKFPEGTVKVYTARGLETLRQILGTELEACHEAAV